MTSSQAPSGASRAAEVTRALRDDIVAGAHSPGERLTEERLALHYNVSRVPVREAIRTLEAEGFLRVVPYAGTTVARLSDREIQDLLDVRAALEVLAVQRAAVHRTREDLARLQEVLAEGAAAASSTRYAAVAALNTRFHLLIAAASGNSELVSVLTTLSAKIQWAYSASVSSRAGASWSEHKSILSKIARGDPEGAAHELEKHIVNARRAVRD
ncbi:MAG: GntR family transcriptional regulator [Actinomycetota bacterium]|nr:GntR family transcriptional regulator [Actinomycetota bacterium]